VILLTSIVSLFIIIQQHYTKSKTQKINPKLTAILSAYSILSIASYIFSQTPNQGLAEITQDLSLFCLFISLIKIPKTTLNLNQFLSSISKIIISIQSVFVIYQVYILKAERTYGTFFHWYDHRLVYPNALGLCLVTTVFLLQNPKQKHQTFWTTLALSSLFFTYSRGAILAGLFTGMLLIAQTVLSKNFKKIIKPITSILIASLIFISTNQLLLNNQPEQIEEKLTFQGTEHITSVMERLQFFTQTPKLIIQKPIFGYGPSSYEYIFPTIQKIPLSNSQHPHNIFLKIGSERGLIALFVFLSIILLTLHKTLTTKDYQSTLHLLLALTAALLHSQIDYNFNLPLNSLLFILILSTIWQKHPSHKINQTYLLIPAILLIFTSQLFFKHLTYKAGAISPLNLSKINYLDSSILAAKQTSNLSQKINLVRTHTQKNKYDSFAISHLGHLYTKNNQLNQAIQQFQKSIQINPKNFWYPYNQLLQAHITTNTNPSLETIQEILNNLTEYQNAAAQNLHYTSQSDNLIQAIQTTENLLKLNLTSTQRASTLNIQKSLRSSHKSFNSN
jgi:O-antigen ligase